MTRKWPYMTNKIIRNFGGCRNFIFHNRGRHFRSTPRHY